MQKVMKPFHVQIRQWIIANSSLILIKFQQFNASWIIRKSLMRLSSDNDRIDLFKCNCNQPTQTKPSKIIESKNNSIKSKMMKHAEVVNHLLSEFQWSVLWEKKMNCSWALVKSQDSVILAAFCLLYSLFC